MKLRGKYFGSALAASGTLNFFGEGWPLHNLYGYLPGFNFSGSTFVAKTMTVSERMPEIIEKGKGKGNLVLNKKTLMPTEFFPDCIVADFLGGRVWNNVSLSGLGAKASFERNLWQQRLSPFFLSYMPVGETDEEQIEETNQFVSIAKKHLPNFMTDVALQYNISCPNAKKDLEKMAEKTPPHLIKLSELGIPILTKTDVTIPVSMLKILSDYCDGFVIPNSLGFGKLPEIINWESHLKYVRRLLRKYGTCGYSGPENFQLAVELIREARAARIEKTIVGGGVNSKKDVRTMKKVGADAIEFGRVSIVRPWRIQGIIEEAYRLFE